MFKLNMFNSKKKQCCICYEKKRNVIKCENKNCKDGIICKACLSKMTESQRKCCQICRVESNNYKIYPKTLVDDIENQIIIMTPKNDHNNIKIITYCCYEQFVILIATVCIIFSTYGLGVLVFYLLCDCDVNTLARTSNPILIILIGIFLLVICICFMFCMRIIIKSKD